MVRIIKHKIWQLIYAILGAISIKAMITVHYYRCFRRPINWKNPKDINEKIQWLKFNSDTSKWTEYADKYKVRKHLSEVGLSEMEVPLLGVWYNVEEIDWKTLPSQFVMKTNHGSGDAFICHDKSQIVINEVTYNFKNLLLQKFGTTMGEPHYDSIPPCIIAEKLLDSRKQKIQSTSLIDYKVFCMNGEPNFILTCHNRTKQSCELGVYDNDWNFHPEYILSTTHYILSKQIIPRPKSLHRFLDAAARLSKGFPMVRVDFYEVNERPYFGEMTFTPCAGFMYYFTQEFLNILGDKCNLHVNTEI